MNQVLQLLYAENVISRKRGAIQQILTFCVRVRNIAYDKQVEIRWAGEDGAWESLFAGYLAPAGAGGEIWLARTSRQASPSASLPGNVEFACALRAAGAEYWVKPERGNYRCEADSGLMLGPACSLVHAGYHPRLQPDQKTLTVDVAVSTALDPQEVFVEWSGDGWRSRQRTPCFAARDHWDRAEQSNARNPNQYGAGIWTGHLRIHDAYAVEYAVGCTTPGGERWDNNQGLNYRVRHAELNILTLNLHCYQEDNQDYKFWQIARAINDLDVDLVCLQEVAENWNDGHGDWGSNAARIVGERLDRPYQLFADWSHLGFGRYREGLAILSRFPLRYRESRYVSASRDVYSINARKAVLAQVDVPYMGTVNVFSAHLSWWRDGFREQFDNLVAWANACHTDGIAATLICGDFNIPAGGEGYAHVVQTSDYEDQYLKQVDWSAFERVYRRRGPDWARSLQGDGRIDYIWLKRGSRLKPVAARRLFLDTDYGRVSDHEGFMVTFEPPT